jgi:hypothetical protein
MHTHPRSGSVASLCLLGVAFVPVPAWAAELSPDGVPHERPRRFGDRGELAISGGSSLTFARTEVSGSSSSPSTSFLFSPGIDWFPTVGLSLGVRVGYAHQSDARLPDSNSFSVGPRVGYDVPLADHWSLWPQVYASTGAAWESDGSRAQSWGAGGYVPVLYHPAPHFFLGLGPSGATVYIPAVGNGQQVTPALTLTTYGLLATVGGWVGI